MLPARPAERAGLKPGDRIVAVDGRPVPTWDELFLTIGGKARREVTLMVERNGEHRAVHVVPTAEGKYEIGDIGILPNTHPYVRSVNVGEPAEKAGIKPGDVVLRINSQDISSARQLSEEIGKHAGQPIVIRVARDKQTLEVKPRRSSADAVGMIGIGDQRSVEADRAGSARSAQDERGAELGRQRSHLPHAGRPVHRRDVPEAVDGPGRHRADLRRVGRERASSRCSA